jgi:hypothetical protein
MGSHWGEKIRRYLQSLYPVAYQRWKVVLISSLVVFLILLVLQPFGISGIRQHKFWILVGFMGVTAVSLSIPMYVFGKLFPKFYKEETWTVWKQIVNLLQILFFIAIGNWIYSTLVFGWGLRWDVFCAFALFTLVIGLFPTVLIMTSNAGSLIIQDNLSRLNDLNREELLEKTRAEVMELLKSNVRPEFLNRIDEICRPAFIIG